MFDIKYGCKRNARRVLKTRVSLHDTYAYIHRIGRTLSLIDCHSYFPNEQLFEALLLNAISNCIHSILNLSISASAYCESHRCD